MRTASTTLLTALLLHALLGCVAPAADQRDTANTPDADTLIGNLPAGLSERPHNASCVAGPASEVGQKLSQLGCFDASMQPGPGMIPYDVIAPLWSDDAEKQRFLAIPDGTTTSVDGEGHFVMPVGTVLLKTFMRDGQRLETRVWMNHPDAGWQGYSYRWDAIGSDALLASEEGEQMPIGSGAEHWTIPGRGQCSQCHQGGPNQNLGLQVAQLDRDFTYPSTGRSSNQLATLSAVGLLAQPAAAAAPGARAPHKLVDYRDASQALDARARSYLHANCSSCHSAAEGYCSGDFRIGTPGAQMGVCDVTAKHTDASWGWPAGTKLVAPGNPEQSALWLRLSAPGGTPMAMPPLGRHEVHQEGVELIAAWITAMRGCEK
jgi:uncharacterized repeat protein (TIGR03806 family)